MSTYHELLAQKEALDAQLAEMHATAVAQAKDQIYAIMSKHGLTIEDLAKRRGRPPKVAVPASGSKGTLPPKYLDPKTGATWSGHGRPPGWIASARNRDKFLIEKSA